jgi:hypothetical protein
MLNIYLCPATVSCHVFLLSDEIQVLVVHEQGDPIKNMSWQDHSYH